MTGRLPPLSGAGSLVYKMSAGQVGLREFLHLARLLAPVWPWGSARSVPAVVIVTWCPSLQIHDLIPFHPHHRLEVVTPFEG